MVIRAKAPLRISFAGGGTDVPPYCDERGGAVLSATIDKYAYASVLPNLTDIIEVNSLDFDIVAKYNCAEELDYSGKLSLVKAVLKNLSVSKGCQVYLHSDAPPGSGLGSSSTLVVAMIGAIIEWQNIAMDNYEIAEKAIRIERKELGIAGGYQDQYSACFGGFNFIEFYKDMVVVNPLRIPDYLMNELEYNLVLCYTGGIRLSANIIEDQIKNYENKDVDSVAAMDELKDIAYAMKSQLLRGNLHNFGRLLHYGWENKKKMSSKITNPKIDELYAEALKAGALGGKLLGAGGGGYLLLYCPNEKKFKVSERMEAMGGQVISWGFDLSGMQKWNLNAGKGENEKFYKREHPNEYTA
ncbi:MAG: GHMP kinase [Clostridiales bacterium]|nr:GHMP kinase [Eubacteriales bacterium]MDH7566501.1 GHMP kinase [Clostridiales bacterium]